MMKRLEDDLSDEMTVSGKESRPSLRKPRSLTREVIRPKENPFHKEGGIAVLFGNLAPQGLRCQAGRGKRGRGAVHRLGQGVRLGG